eukprot:1177448-Prymnesium_polylepis.1
MFVTSRRSVVRYEREHRLSYAWVIRTRPDLAFFDRVPPAVAMSTRRLVCMEKESNPSYFDGFWMVRALRGRRTRRAHARANAPSP